MRQVIRHRDFALLWFAGLISLIGDWMLLVALPVTVYQLTGSAVATSGIVIAGHIPSLLLGSLAGVFVDRWDRKRTMVAVNLVRAPVLLLLLAVDTAEQVWIAYPDNPECVASCGRRIRLDRAGRMEGWDVESGARSA